MKGPAPAWRKHLVPLLALTAVCTGVTALGLHFPALKKYDNMAVDYLFYLRGERPSPPGSSDDVMAADPEMMMEPPLDTMVVALDAKSLEHVGRWPWPRGVLARLLHDICRGQPTTVALDVLLDRPDSAYGRWFYQEDQSFDPEKQDRMLSHALSSCPNPVLAVLYKFDGGEEHRLEPIPLFQQAQGSSMAFVNLPVDATDQKVRKARLAWRDQSGDLQLSFALRAYLHHKGLDPSAVRLDGHALHVGDLTVPLDRDGNMWINWAATPPTEGNTTPPGIVSAWDLLENDDPELIEMMASFMLEGKAVFIGLTDPEEKDMFTTPFSINETVYPNWGTIGGVRVHEQVMRTLLDRAFLQSQPPGNSLLWLAPMLFLVLVLFTRSHVLGALSLPVLVGGLFTGAQHWFNEAGIIVPVVTPVAGLLMTGAVGMGYRLLTVDREKRQTANLFKSYVAPHVLQELMQSPGNLGLGGKRSEVTVLFSDVRGFTTLSEQLEPEQLVSVLNLYLEKMTQVIFHSDGMVDKFIGDAIMALWGAPTPHENDQEKAIDAALGMVDALKVLNPTIREYIGVPFAIGIGLNSGPATLGNIGSQGKLDYTVIGDSVNLAARLEGLTKQYGVQLIVSENTMRGVQDKFYHRSLDLVIVKGKTKPVEIFEVLGKR